LSKLILKIIRVYLILKILLKQVDNALGMIKKGTIYFSSNGIIWEYFDTFEFGNLINNPPPRAHYFNTKAAFRFVKIVVNTMAGNKT